MTGPYAIADGRLVPVSEAVFPADDISFSYGYGVYETLKVRGRVLFFPDEHEERLFRSASIIGLEHPFQRGRVTGLLRELGAANRVENANIKVMLLGGDRGSARLYAMVLAPLFPDRKLYRDGAIAIIVRGERFLPAAKSLNMLASTMAFRTAQAQGAYDAVFCNRRGLLTEGTRTNLFFTDGNTVFTPPARSVLAGVTRHTLILTMRRHGMPFREAPLPLRSLPACAGLCLSSTSTKLMPIARLGDVSLPRCALFDTLARHYNDFLDEYAAGQPVLFGDA